MSPRPKSEVSPFASDGWWMIGMMVRVIRFQSVAELERDHGLEVEDVLGPLARADVEVDVVLERHADQVGDRVLRLLRQPFRAAAGLLGAGVTGRERQGQEAGRPWRAAACRSAEASGGASGGMSDGA